MTDRPLDYTPESNDASATSGLSHTESRAKAARARAAAPTDGAATDSGFSASRTGAASSATSESPAHPANVAGSASSFRRPKSRSVAVPVVAALVIGAVIGGASGAGIAVLVSQQGGTVTASQGHPDVVINNAAAVNDVSAVAAKASPSVVTILVSSSTVSGSGSGVVVSKDGYIVTNNHVVTLDGQTNQATWQVEDSNGRLYSAKVVGTDPTVDLAVLKVDGVTDWTPIEWADSSKLNVGDVTIAMGAPLGLAGTVTSGIVSALNRSIQIGSSAVPDQQDQSGQGQSSPYGFWNFDFGQGQTQPQTATRAAISIPVIQTDAAINPGNSGGALLDAQGRLIGINVAIANAGSSGSAGSIGVGFALPSNLAKRVSDEIIAKGSATHGFLGASLKEYASVQGSTQVGAQVKEVTSGGPAQKAGIQVDDVVVQANGVPISTSSDLTAQVRSLAPGSDIELVIVRGGKTQTITVTLGELK